MKILKMLIVIGILGLGPAALAQPGWDVYNNSDQTIFLKSNTYPSSTLIVESKQTKPGWALPNGSDSFQTCWYYTYLASTFCISGWATGSVSGVDYKTNVTTTVTGICAPEQTGLFTWICGLNIGPTFSQSSP